MRCAWKSSDAIVWKQPVNEILGSMMPICTNPKCGEISKTSYKFCPYCGQQSLSTIDKNQMNGNNSGAITMENFERITGDVPAPRERVAPKERSKKRRRSFWNKSKE